MDGAEKALMFRFGLYHLIRKIVTGLFDIQILERGWSGSNGKNRIGAFSKKRIYPAFSA
jgi:hypothetical protein